MTVKKILISLLGITFLSTAFSQSRNSLHRELKWGKPVEFSITETEKITVLNFEGADYDAGKNFLPVYNETFSSLFDASVIEAIGEMKNDLYEPLSESQVITDASFIKNTIDLKVSIGYERKKPFIAISLIPIRKNPVTNFFEKLVSFDIQLTPSKTGFAGNKSQVSNFASNSVLATGTWYKIGVTTAGIYKIDYNFLKNLGIDMNTLNPQQIKIFGNGIGMLPEYNATPRPDDIVENAIEVVGEADGIFNSGDYILFAGASPYDVKLDPVTQRYHVTKHLYTDTSFYFLTTDLGGPSKRITTQPSVTPGTNDIQVNASDAIVFHEENIMNFVKSGRNFYGETFDLSQTIPFQANVPNIITSEPVYYKLKVLAHSFITSSFDIKYNGQQVCHTDISPITPSSYSDWAKAEECTGTFLVTGSDLTLEIIYNKPASTSVGYLDLLEMNARRQLIMNGNQMGFYDKNTVGPGNTAFYTIGNYYSTLTVWDVTDQYNVKKQEVSTSGTFRAPADILRNFMIFRNDNFLTPGMHGRIDNQNLHSSPQTDLIIVTNPKFLSEANRLADFHRSNDSLRVVIAEINQVYNEYSSGMRDVSAIRDFVKMFYDRSATDIPRYLLLFGDGSYENKNDYSGNTNFIPTYQSENSLSILDSYVSDDFYGLLDPTEGNWTPGSTQFLDVGVGRLPVKSLEEAKNMVEKVIRYSTPGSVTDPTACNSSNSSFGDWRNNICLVADDEDSGIHLDQTDALLNNLDPMIFKYNVDKFYLDAYQQETTPGGQRYPDVNDAIDKKMEKGTLIMNFTGHGGELGWTHEDILNNSMINAWTNKYRMPIFLTATCEFSRFDDPARTSAGEHTLLNANGGVIALYSTTRLVYSFPNAVLNKDMVIHMFEKINGEMPRLGDIFRLSKRDNAGAGVNPRNFTLLGDPAVRLAYPKYDILAIKINNQNLAGTTDTISALTKVTFSGEIQNNGQKMNNFNGVIYPTVFDKAVLVKTLSNDPGSPALNFKLQKNILYKGKASVINGEFSFTFIVPKDIAYNFGTGRLSFYAQNGAEDASGYYDSLIIGGVSTSSISDNAGPEIKLYLNDEKFVFGGITDTDPKIFALVNDSNGINTVGNGIGHDITAILDNDIENSYVLNDYYESDIDNYQKGKIIYSLNKLSEGRHNLKLKVWDIYNNSSESYTEFIVASSSEIALAHVLNYPNPFTTHTSFFFEHNQACNDLDVQVQIYTVSGKLIKTLQKHLLCEGYRSDSIEWDGKDDFGDRIGKGVYVYRLKVNASGGKSAEKFEKLVVLR